MRKIFTVLLVLHLISCAKKEPTPSTPVFSNKSSWMLNDTIYTIINGGNGASSIDVRDGYFNRGITSIGINGTNHLGISDSITFLNFQFGNGNLSTVSDYSPTPQSILPSGQYTTYSPYIISTQGGTLITSTGYVAMYLNTQSNYYYSDNGGTVYVNNNNGILTITFGSSMPFYAYGWVASSQSYGKTKYASVFATITTN